ncbi:hypothetical protein [Thermospira aquatica]|uniref:Uncharacterized protein n=1 Tax=Thermospira aquatica TaxID=2828656 RepID=A0AAX3BFC4_9SPIR|nr:hypothetical protein [Thermospira aquatica]URA10969.1 hypothetical protein KDW03_03970 [Thermospira aquatica]
MKRILLLLFCITSSFFSIEWMPFEGKNWRFSLDGDSGGFVFFSSKTNYLYYESDTATPTSGILVLYEGSATPFSPFSPFLSWNIRWQKTNHVIFGRATWESIVYTSACFLTNNGQQMFVILATHISNTSSEAKEVGFRYLLDTTLEENGTGPLFVFENGAPVMNEMEISLNQYGKYILSGQKSGIYLLPAYNGFSPRAIYLANYHRLKTSEVNVRIEPSAHFTYDTRGKRDGAILVDYRYRLRPGETIEGGIVLSLEPLPLLQWNTSLFDFLPQPQEKKKIIPSTSSNTKAFSWWPFFKQKTNVVYITNTIEVIPGDENYLALQQSFIDRLEKILFLMTNQSPALSSNVASSLSKSPDPGTHEGFSSPQASWLPSDDPFGRFSDSLPKSRPFQTNQMPTLIPFAEKQESPSTPLPSVQPSENFSQPRESTVFITNVITNYITLTNVENTNVERAQGYRIQEETEKNQLKMYEEKIQQLQRQLFEKETTQSAQKKLLLIEKRLELLNWLLERSSKVNLSAEDIAAMNAELDLLLKSLEEENKR